MIWKPIQDYQAFVMVICMPEGTRKRRSLWRLNRVNPVAYKTFMQMYADSIQKTKKGKRSR